MGEAEKDEDKYLFVCLFIYLFSQRGGGIGGGRRRRRRRKEEEEGGGEKREERGGRMEEGDGKQDNTVKIAR